MDSDAKTKPQGISRKVLYIVGASVLAALVLGLVVRSLLGRDKTASQRATYVVKRGDLPITVRQTGELQASESIRVIPEIKGQATIIQLVDEGTYIKKGDVMAKLDAAEMEKRETEQDIQVQNALANVTRAQEEKKMQVLTNDTSIAQAKLSVQNARMDLAKYGIVALRDDGFLDLDVYGQSESVELAAASGGDPASATSLGSTASALASAKNSGASSVASTDSGASPVRVSSLKTSAAAPASVKAAAPNASVAAAVSSTASAAAAPNARASAFAASKDPAPVAASSTDSKVAAPKTPRAASVSSTDSRVAVAKPSGPSAVASTDSAASAARASVPAAVGSSGAVVAAGLGSENATLAADVGSTSADLVAALSSTESLLALPPAAILPEEVSSNALVLDKQALYERCEAYQGFRDAELAIRRSMTDLERAQLDFKDMDKLLEKGFVTQNDFLNKKLALDEGQRKLESDRLKHALLLNYTYPKTLAQKQADLRQALNGAKQADISARSQMAQRDAAIRQAEAVYKMQKKDLDELRDRLKKMTVLAPEDGLVLYGDDRGWYDKSEVKVGGKAYEGRALFTLPKVSKMLAATKVMERDVYKVKVGLPAVVELPALPGTSLSGKVSKISSVSSSSRRSWMPSDVKTFDVEVALDQSDARMKPGMSCDVEVIVGTLTGVLYVPANAVFHEDSEDACYVVSGAKVTPTKVVVGERNDLYTEVKEGLKEGQQVLLYSISGQGEAGKPGAKKPGEAGKAKAAGKGAPAGAASTDSKVAVGSTASAVASTDSKTAGAPAGKTASTASEAKAAGGK